MVWAGTEDIFDVRMRSRIAQWVKTPEKKDGQMGAEDRQRDG